MNDIQILYPATAGGQINQWLSEEAEAMKNFGFITDVKPCEHVSNIIYRGFTINNAESYPTEKRMIQGWEAYKRTFYMSEYLRYITEFTIPTVLTQCLTEDIIKKIITENEWEKVFIKSETTSLFSLSEKASIWPDTPLNQIIEEYSRRNIRGPFAVRQFINVPEIFYNEQRYWVLNGNTYHPSGIIPNFVEEAAKKIYNFSHSHYFTIDVAGSYIVEINPGESSDRGGDTPIDFFCEIFAKEFLLNNLFEKHE